MIILKVSAGGFDGPRILTQDKIKNSLAKSNHKPRFLLEPFASADSEAATDSEAHEGHFTLRTYSFSHVERRRTSRMSVGGRV